MPSRRTFQRPVASVNLLPSWDARNLFTFSCSYASSLFLYLSSCLFSSFVKIFFSLARTLSLFVSCVSFAARWKKWVGGMKWQGEMRRSGEESGSTVRESLFLHAPSARTDRSPLSRSQYTPRRYIAAARKGIPDTKHAAFRNIVPAKRRRRRRRCRRRWRRAAATAVDALDGRSSRRTRGATLFLASYCCFTAI